jgi:hypothetical protein
MTWIAILNAPRMRAPRYRGTVVAQLAAVRRPTTAIPILLTALAVLLRPAPASAALGGDVSSVQADQARMQAAVTPVASSPDFNIHEMRAATGVTVREYVSPAGTVFAVSWEGPSMPDLKQLLGDYFATYMDAAQAARKKRNGRAPLHIETSTLVVEQGGHPRAFTGRAYVPQLMPARVAAQSIR